RRGRPADRGRAPCAHRGAPRWQARPGQSGWLPACRGGLRPAGRRLWPCAAWLAEGTNRDRRLMSEPEPTTTVTAVPDVPAEEFVPVAEQLNRVLHAAVRPNPVRVAISEAQGLPCAEEVVAEQALPGFDQAAVDGYAVRSVDVRTAGEEPVQLPVVGEIQAGSRQPRRLQPGQAVRVATGAPLPTLADAVVPTAFTDGHQAKVTVQRSVPSAGYVRRTGEDVQIGDVAVREGDTIGSAQVGLL